MTSTTYLNTASCGLIAPSTLETANTLYAAFAYNSSKYSEQWSQQDERRIRQLVADFVGAPVTNIALIPNFSWGVNAVVQSLKGTERILLYKGDFPSLTLPFTINNFPITWVDTPDKFHINLDEVVDAISSKSVDIVALSHVQWSSGHKIDMKKIGDLCKEYGVLFFVDATQSLGAMPINLRELQIDVLIASNYKWMNAGFGTGVLYAGDSFLEAYPPVVSGYHSERTRMLGGLDSMAINYEPGSPNMFGLSLLEAAIIAKNETGIEQIQQYNFQLMQRLLMGIKTLPINILGDYTMNNRASIVLLQDKDGLGEWITKHNIVVTQRNGMLRASTHFHNTEEEVDLVVECLRKKFE